MRRSSAANSRRRVVTNRFIKLLLLLLSVDRADIFRVYGYAALQGFISLSLPLGIQASYVYPPG